MQSNIDTRNFIKGIKMGANGIKIHGIQFDFVK